MSSLAPVRDHARRQTVDRPPLSRVSDNARPNLAPVAPLPSKRRHLQTAPRTRRTASIVAMGCVVLFGLLLGTVALQTRIAQNQLALDKTERDVKVARERYDVLRRARAELRSPNRLDVEATNLGMVPAAHGEFMTIAPLVVARIAASSGWLANDPAENSVSSFDQFGQVKAVAGDAP